MAKKQDSAGV